MKATSEMALLALAVAAILALFGLTGQGDAEAAQKQRAQYCQMVAIWEADKAQGVEPEYRNGWPPYEGDCPDA